MIKKGIILLWVLLFAFTLLTVANINQVQAGEIAVLNTANTLPALRVNVQAPPNTLDPQAASFAQEVSHLMLVYEGLTMLNDELATVPGAAESWQYNEDATTLTFTLRPGLQYSDGSLLNAQRFEYSIMRAIDPVTDSYMAFMLDVIIGAPEWRSADYTAPNYDPEIYKAALGVEALTLTGSPCTSYTQTDCLRLKLSFSETALYFHSIMALWLASPAMEENILAGGDTWWSSPQYQVGNGAFVMTSFQSVSGASFVPNTHYRAGLAQVNIDYSYILDPEVALAAYKNNLLEINPTSSSNAAEVMADPVLSAEHMLYAGTCTNIYKFGLAAEIDGEASPMQDPKVREAFALAFDAARWSEEIDGGLSLPTWTWLPPGFPGYDPASPIRFDVPAAQAALAASTYGSPDALNALGLKLSFSDTSALNRTRAQWVVDNYYNNLGVVIALDPLDSESYTNLVNDPSAFPLMARMGWCADFPDPQNFLSYWRSTSTSAQRQGYANLAFDALMDLADAELDPDTRLDLYHQAEQVMLADFPAAFGVNSTNHYLVKPWVSGVVTTPQDIGFPGIYNLLNISIDMDLKYPFRLNLPFLSR